ncbi:hypothetical protein MHB85_19240 [Paenibacillus sp. FSL K6-4396]|uniref:hypothetical protein n=1 Tax=Paenibacillus sp. FSL K6-4396 TaxID=2921506 RepID=UPI0030F9C7A6
MKPVDQAKNIADTVLALKKAEAEVQCFSDKELNLLRSDINSILEQNKLSSVLSVGISLLLFSLPLYFSSIKEMLMEITSIILENKIQNGLIIDKEKTTYYIGIFINFLLALIALIIARGTFKRIIEVLENARYFSSLDKIIEGVIKGREILSATKDKTYEKFIEKNYQRRL